MATKKKMTGKRWALIAVAVVLAFMVYKRHRAGQTNVADPAVPFTPSPYFYTSPFADSGGGSSGSGGSSSGSGSSATTSGPIKDPHPKGGTVIPVGTGSGAGGNSQGTVFSGGSGVPIHNRV